MYPATVRRQIVAPVRSGEAVAAIGPETGIYEATLFRWKRQAQPAAVGLLIDAVGGHRAVPAPAVPRPHQAGGREDTKGGLHCAPPAGDVGPNPGKGQGALGEDIEEFQECG